MVQVGFGFTVTFVLHRPGQPLRVMSSVIVYPEPQAITLTVALVVGPRMVQPPLTDQLCLTVPPGGLTVEACVLVVPKQNGPGLLMLQVGFGFTVRRAVQLVTQPSGVVICTV